MLNGKLFVRKIIIWLLNLVEKFHLHLKIDSKKYLVEIYLMANYLLEKLSFGY